MGAASSNGARVELAAGEETEAARADRPFGLTMSKHTVRVVEAEYVKAHQIRLTFTDGTKKVVNFSRWFHGEVFKPLASKREFRRFFVAGGTVCWPNGADIAPETLYTSKDVSAGAA
jgi:hypothetical protein